MVLRDENRGGYMSNNSGKKIKWTQIDQRIEDGWYIIKLDGSQFKPLRTPNISLDTLKKYYEVIQEVSIETMERFRFMNCVYIIDDEFHFLFHTNNIKEDMRRISKVIVKPATYAASLVNQRITKEEFKSEKTIKYGKLCYDGRLIKLTREEIIPYFDDVINHGKMFIGNNIVGEGRYFVRLSMKEIRKKALAYNFNFKHEHMSLIGRFVVNSETCLKVEGFKFYEYRDKVFKILNTFDKNPNPFMLYSK